MPLTGHFKQDVSELMRECKKRGKFGTQTQSSFGVCRKRALAAAYSAERRKHRKGEPTMARRKHRKHSRKHERK